MYRKQYKIQLFVCYQDNSKKLCVVFMTGEE